MAGKRMGMIESVNKKRQLLGTLILATAFSVCELSLGAAAEPDVAPNIRAALERISPASLRGHLSFIASDLLEGRGTPSRGLDIAAEYIAAQFRRAGLEPVGDDGYFQTAKWLTVGRDATRFELIVEHTKDGTKQAVHIALDRVASAVDRAIHLTAAPLIKVKFDDADALEALTKEQVAGKAVLTEMPALRGARRSPFRQVRRDMRRFVARMRELEAALILSVDREGPIDRTRLGRLIDPENRRSRSAGLPLLTIRHDRLAALLDSTKDQPLKATVTARIEPAESPIGLRNVVGLLPGSDPALKATYILVTAHYDHLGVRGSGDGDNIYNGANDDGSGTVTVIELAAALSSLEPRPKRSILFMTFFGEERGLLGSRYYASHPIFPIEKTIAHINLEQVGRTDSDEGPQLNNASITGIDYSDIGRVFKQAGEQTGIEVYKHATDSDRYFGASDNVALARLGVPAHTVCVTYRYDNYHGPGDHWDKIDYENMARVARMIALGVVTIANSDREPRWNKNNRRAGRYYDAWKKRREKE